MSLQSFLQRSGATEAFRDALGRFLRDGRPNEAIRFHPYSPAVKVERTLTKVLEAYPELEIERVEIDAVSGCELFRGTATIGTAGEQRRVRFHWDCRWRAMEEGWTDYFGFPDQVRAAREFGHDCFRTWEEIEVVRAGEVVVDLDVLQVVDAPAEPV